jgi:hypothetical protein
VGVLFRIYNTHKNTIEKVWLCLLPVSLLNISSSFSYRYWHSLLASCYKTLPKKFSHTFLFQGLCRNNTVNLLTYGELDKGSVAKELTRGLMTKKGPYYYQY